MSLLGDERSWFIGRCLFISHCISVWFVFFFAGNAKHTTYLGIESNR